MIYQIYKYTSPSGKSYIGQTKNPKARENQHKKKSSLCIGFVSAIKKYGFDSMQKEILKEGLTLAEANHFESLYILEHNTLSPNGYNLTTGGDNAKFSEETRAKMSVAQKNRAPASPETREKISVAQKGRIVSEETKEKISGKNNYWYGKKGKYHHAFGRVQSIEEKESRSKDYIILTPNNELKILKGISSFCLENNLNINIMYKISNNCKYRDSHKGHKCYHYSDETYERLLLDIENNISIIVDKEQVCINKEWIVVYPSGKIEIVNGLNNFCKENMLSMSNMGRVADTSNNSKQHKGYGCYHYSDETYNRLILESEFGEVCRNTVSIDMLGLA